MHHEQVSPGFVEKVRQYPRFSIYLGFIFLITLSDALLSYWTPIYIQNIVGSATIMGIILAVSSIVGLIADTYLPQLIKKINITKLMLFTAIFSVLFVITILSSQYIFTILLLLIAVGFWGIYYELLAFTNAIFLTKVSNSENRSSFWAILYSFKNSAYMLGPLLGAALIVSDGQVPLFAFFFTALSVIPALFIKSKTATYNPKNNHHHNYSILTELRYWRVLFARIWPIVILSFWLGIIDSVFWTTGTIWSLTLAEKSIVGGLLLTAYSFPTLVAGFALSKWKINVHKKITAEFFVLAGGIFLLTLGIVPHTLGIIALTFMASAFLSLAYPLIDATYTDITVRMHGNKQHLIGLSYSTNSLAYIIGPIVAGLLSDLLTEQKTFLIIGFITILTSALLLLITPSKLRLPQKEIDSWNT